MSEQVKLIGGCHCGAIEFIATVPKQVKSINCNCSICTMTGYKHLNVSHSDFMLRNGDSDLSEYNFGTGKARHLFCKNCGIKSYSVNLNCCENTNELEIETIDFDGQNWEASVHQIQDK